MSPEFRTGLEKIDEAADTVEALVNKLLESSKKGDDSATAFLLMVGRHLNSMASNIEGKAWRVRELQKKCNEAVAEAYGEESR